MPNRSVPLSDIYKSNQKSLKSFTDAAKSEGYNDDEIATHWLGKTSKTSKSSTTTSPERREGTISNLYDALKSESKIAELPKTEVANEKEYISALAALDKDKMRKLVNDEIVNQIASESQLRTEINEKIGISGELSKDLRDTIMDSYPEAVKFGYGIDQITKFMTTMMETSGRFNLISTQTLEKGYATARAFVGDMGEFADTISAFEKVGIGARSAMADIDKAGSKSLELGLRSKTTIKDIRDNIDKINSYGFKNGIEGLAEMSRRAVEFRMNMNEAFKIADQVMDPEKALSLTANLQVLGGAIGDFNDPLKLMYMATNNVEGLQDALIDAAGSLASYNSEQGRFEITGVNLRRAKEMAKELGVEYNELAKGAIAAQERQAAAMDLAGRGFDINKEDKEFLTNLSRMEKGKMIIDVPESLMKKLGITDSQLELSDLTKQQIDVLIKNREDLKKMDAKQIAEDQFTSVKNIERMVNSMLKQQARGLITETVGKEGLDIDTRAKSFYQMVEDFGNKNSEFTKQQIASLKESTRDLFKQAFAEGDMEGFENKVKGLLEDAKRKAEDAKRELERKKEEESKKGGAFNTPPQNINLKSNIDVKFPFGFGIPTAEMKGSYLQT